MQTMRRTRNAAFLALLLTLAWGGETKLKADTGGYFACYGYCTILWDCDQSVQSDYVFMEDGGACIRLVGCRYDEVTVYQDDPWATHTLQSSTSPAYVDFEVYDRTIYSTGYGGCTFSLPLPD